MLSRGTGKASEASFALSSRRVVTPEGIRAAAVLVRDEKILAVVEQDQVPAGVPVEDVGDRFVLPGLVDIHVHINEPGRTEWEGFDSATRSAAAGGVTTVVDMPLNSSPVTTTPEAFAAKLGAAKGKLWVDCGFYGGVVPGNARHLASLAEKGALGFKTFLCPSGIDEFPASSEAVLREAMPIIARTGLPLLAHAETPGPLPDAIEKHFVARPRSYRAYLASRPRPWEQHAIELLIDLCREYRCRTHIVHLSSADAVPVLAAARAEGLPLTVETCPHYLFFAAEDIPDGDPRFKCAPPIRERENREQLWKALRSGTIDTIGSDHSPAPAAMKQLDSGDLLRAWGGIASLQLSLSAIWTAAQRQAGITLANVVNWMCTRPAQLVDLGARKGAIAPGYDADLVVFDASRDWTVQASKLHHRHKATPYEGQQLQGAVDMTFLRGRKVYEANRFLGEPSGEMIYPCRSLASSVSPT